MATQLCSVCKEEKDESQFAPSRRGKRGFPCRECVRAESARRRQEYGNEDREYQCGRCRQLLPGASFHASRRTNGGYCKSCTSEWNRQRRADGGDTEALRLRCAKYGITVAQFHEMLLAQFGRCAICQTFDGVGLHIDHDEESGKVRGLLCGSCNRAIGLLHHEVGRVLSAAQYLRASQGTETS